MVAAACRGTSGRSQDRIVGALLAVAAGDELAQLTVVAGLADRLRQVVRGWAAAGAAPWEVHALAAELVAECWVVVAELTEGSGPLPPACALHVVDEAREAVRVPRRRERRLAHRSVPLLDVHPIGSPGVTMPELLAREISSAVQTGRITLGAAKPVFLTRVVGLDVPAAARQLGCAPAALRMARSRAERRLAA